MTLDQGATTGRSDLRAKGQSKNSVGLTASVVLGVSSIAPVYALTATLGPTVTEVGLQMPAIFLAGFLPMLLVAYAYRELNRVAPDCGTSFTWTTKAFNPYVGWLAGWGALLATIIVLSNLAGIAVEFFYLLLGEVTGSESLGALGDNTLVHVLTCIAFVALATWVTYRGLEATKRVQYTLVGFQMVVLAVFAVVALANDSRFGLGGSIFSGDTIRARKLASRIETGMVFINTTTTSMPELPFGGVKRSGFGRELGRFGIDEFVNKKMIRIS